MPRVRVALQESLGLILADDLVSDIDSPPHDKAMMDGYAVAPGDASRERRVLEEVTAGGTPTLPVTPGAVTRIMTGAPLPPGAAAVTPVEQTEEVDAHTVRMPAEPPRPGKHVMPRGDAFAKGDRIAQRGQPVNAALAALLAEAGHASLPAHPRPRVATLATGDELVDASQTPGPGQIRNSNGPMLQALIREAGAEGVSLGVARDNAQSLSDCITQARDADALLVSGGVSAGTRDLAPAVLNQLGVRQVFHKVAVKPGKPLWFGVWPGERRDTLVFGLPGNPVSSYVCFQLFVRAALSLQAGGPAAGLPEVTAVLTEPIGPQPGRDAYLPAVLEGDAGRLCVAPTAWRGSADLRGLAAANALVKAPAGTQGLAAGAVVVALPTGALRSRKYSRNS